jgi:hypothetical protein
MLAAGKRWSARTAPALNAPGWLTDVLLHYRGHGGDDDA